MDVAGGMDGAGVGTVKGCVALDVAGGLGGAGVNGAGVKTVEGGVCTAVC